MRSLLIVLYTSVFLGGWSAVAAEHSPNIVYLLVDDLGYADCGFMGSRDIRTPHIDQLAKGGVVLESFYVQPVCSPTRAALLTGRYATHTGVYTIVRPGAPWGLPLAERLLPEALREAGYSTFICDKWHLGEFQPAAVDKAIGQITTALEEKGLRRDTLIVFSSANGGPAPGRATMNTPLRAGKGTIYEGGIRACAFANWPGTSSRIRL